MSKRNHNAVLEKNIIGIDKNKITVEAKKNENKANVIEDCKEFCNRYSNIDFNLLKVAKLREICEQARGMLDNYFIINEPAYDNTIMKLEHILMNASYVLMMQQISETRQQTAKALQQIHSTMHRANRIEKDIQSTSKKMKNVENDIKTIITVIISIVLAISIIPTAIAGIEKVSSNYILPFLSSVVLFGMIMIAFVYSIYQEHLKISTCFILILGIIICIGLWIFSFNINIEVSSRQTNIVIEQSENYVNN